MMKVEWTPEKEEKVKKLIEDFIDRHRVSCAESVMQCDNPNLESPVLVGEIVDVLEPYRDADPYEE